MVRKKLNFAKCVEMARMNASKSSMKYKHGCVIVSQHNEFLSQGYNISYNQLEHGKWSLHAEMNAIEKAIKKHGIKSLENAKLFVVRIRSHLPLNFEKKLQLSKPCSRCEKLILKYKIGIAYYSTNENP